MDIARKETNDFGVNLCIREYTSFKDTEGNPISEIDFLEKAAEYLSTLQWKQPAPSPQVPLPHFQTKVKLPNPLLRILQNQIQQ